MSEIGCSQQCDDLCHPPTRIWLFFGNGILNTRQAAKKSLRELNRRLYPFLKSKYPSTLRYLVAPELGEIAYNTDLGAVLQLLEAVGQKTYGKFYDFFYWLSELKKAPPWFRKQVSQIEANSRFARLLDSDLKKQVDGFLSHLKDGDGIVVVAHSQGNLYRDEAFRVVNEVSGRPSSASFGSVSVATPSENASAGEIPMGRDWYTTLFSDPVIALLPTALPANTKNDHAGLFDHTWLTYLNGDRSGVKILEDVACVVSRLTGTLISPSLRTYEDGCRPAAD